MRSISKQEDPWEERRKQRKEGGKQGRREGGRGEKKHT
jgi:hypothetical protein